jgi:hypothetical protein
MSTMSKEPPRELRGGYIGTGPLPSPDAPPPPKPADAPAAKP